MNKDETSRNRCPYVVFTNVIQGKTMMGYSLFRGEGSGPPVKGLPSPGGRLGRLGAPGGPLHTGPAFVGLCLL